MPVSADPGAGPAGARSAALLGCDTEGAVVGKVITNYRCMVEYKSRRGSQAQVSPVCGSKVGSSCRLIGVSPKASAGMATTLLEHQLKALYWALERERDRRTALG